MLKKIKNIFAEKQKEAKNKLNKSYSWKFASGVAFVFTIVFGFTALLFTFLSDSSQSASKQFDKWSQENYEQAHKELTENNIHWQRGVKQEAENFNKGGKRIKTIEYDDTDFVELEVVAPAA